MSSELPAESRRPEHSGSDATSGRRPMSTAARQRLAGIIASRAEDHVFLRNVDAVRRSLGKDSTGQQ